MKIAFIFVLFKTPDAEIDRLKKEVKNLHLNNTLLYFIDNTMAKKGYAHGVNKGIKKGLKKGCDIFIVANPDISLKGINAKQLLEGGNYFDIWGFAMGQDKTYYYGGVLDTWRLSAILVRTKPIKRFIRRDFVTGSLMAIKRKVIDKIGFMDESYNMYYEDVDFCKRAVLASFRVGVDSLTTYTHFEWSTNNPQKKKLLRRNRLKFFLKYSNPAQKIYELLRLPKTTLEWFLLQ